MFNRKMSEIVLGQTNMYCLNLAQQIVRYIFQGPREVTQATIATKERHDHSTGRLNVYYHGEVSVTVDDRGTLVNVEISLDFFRRDRLQLQDRAQFGPCNHLISFVRSVPALSGVHIAYDIHALWEREQVVRCDCDSTVAVMRTWRELGLPTDRAVT